MPANPNQQMIKLALGIAGVAAVAGIAGRLAAGGTATATAAVEGTTAAPAAVTREEPVQSFFFRTDDDDWDDNDDDDDEEEHEHEHGRGGFQLAPRSAVPGAVQQQPGAQPVQPQPRTRTRRS